MFSILELKVIATLAYSNQFEYPLDQTEIFHRLISSAVLVGEGWAAQARSETIIPHKIQATLMRLQELGTVTTNGTYWALAGFESSFRLRVSRTRQTHQKHATIMSLTRMLSRIPGVVGAAITGSVAVNNATANDDIDVLVITSSRRLWLTRLWVLSLTLLAGRRVRLHRVVGNAWCFNLWLESDHLSVPKNKRTLYEAYEILQAQFIWSKPGLRLAWLTANAWVAEFVPTEYYRQLAAAQTLPAAIHHQSHWSQYVGVVLLEVVNKWSYWLQTGYRWLRYQESPRNLETAFFHEPSTKKLIYSQWRRLVMDAYQVEPEKPRVTRRSPHTNH